jgi:cyclophilin family peptidyl-prolyl cis-trans isomerase
MNGPRDDTRALFGRSIGAALFVIFGGAAVAGASLVGGCGKSSTTKAAAGAGSAAASGPEARVRALDLAADQRDLRGFTEVDLAHLDPAVRRAAARGLSRLRAPAALPSMLRLLADRDGETVAFAAYGLGAICAGNESSIVPPLVARAASFASVASEKRSGHVEPAFAIARALGACGSESAELALRGWLLGQGPNAGAAALGLGDIATKRKLFDESIVALLGAAEKGNGDALFPFSRTTVEGASTVRVREVAEAALGRKGATRVLAVRALGRTDAAAVPALAAVLARSREDTDVERAEAARALGRLGGEGQRALLAALPSLAPGKTPIALVGLVADPFGPLTTLLDELRPPVAATALDDLADLPLPPDALPPVRLRIKRLRCAAAQLRADADVDDAKLRACDPDNGDLGTLARLTVVARRALSDPKRRAIVVDASTSSSALVRSRVLELIGAHPELENGWPLLAAGLAHAHPGTVSAAADALAKRRDLLHGDNKAAPRAEIVKAVADALARPFGADDTEVRLSLLELAGLIKEPALTKDAAAACASPSAAVREKTKRTLTALAKDELATACDAPLSAAAKELVAHEVVTGRILLVTDAGELTLRVDGAATPTAAARLLDLAREGFFKDMAIHRVVPGFVVQFGDPAGDGTGGAHREPLRCETAPAPFEPLTIGVALAGRDTGSSQFFVTLSRVPHLDGAYTTIGTAEGDWAAVTEGDRIREVRVSGP